MKSFALVVIALMLTACGTSTQFMKTGESAFESISAGCDFAVYTTNPKKEFEEIGLVEFGVDFVNGRPDSLASAKKEASPFVCKTGGNGLLVWETNGHGRYLKATIIRFK